MRVEYVSISLLNPMHIHIIFKMFTFIAESLLSPSYIAHEMNNAPLSKTKPQRDTSTIIKMSTNLSTPASQEKKNPKHLISLNDIVKDIMILSRTA